MRRSKRRGSKLKWLWILLAGAAVAQELRKPEDEREWNGRVAGFVPYDFRVPTVERIRERLWEPQQKRLVAPQVFGVGWSMNLGRVARIITEKDPDRRRDLLRDSLAHPL
ncbi:MAG: DUF5808 domain-containing protein [Actinomycetota bacterium]